MKKVALFVLSIAAMVSYAAAFSAFSAAKMHMLGARKPARMRCARTLSMQYEKLSEQEFAKLVKEGYKAPEGSEARNKWLAAVKVRQQEDFERSKNQDFYRPEFKKWKDENPQLWTAAQYFWIFLVFASVVFPGAFSGMFGAP